MKEKSLCNESPCGKTAGYSAKENKGITLIELLTVVILIGIIAAMAVPNFNNAIIKIKHKSAARDLLGKMRMARSYAISRGVRYGVYINTAVDPANRYYITFRDMESDGDYDAGTDGVKDSTALDANLSFGTCTFVDSAVVFKNDGSALGGGYIGVVNDKNHDTTRVNVTAAVGRVWLSQ